MDIMEISIMHHVVIVLLMIWLLSSLNFCHPIAYFVFFIYLCLVHGRYIVRLRKKLEFEESRQANQRRVLSDSETVRWLNYAVEKMWPICMENIASQKFLLPIIPWFLEKYKPWTAKKAEVQHLYLGRNAPMFTDIRVLRQSTDDDHLVLELGMNFLTADDMSGIIAVKLRRRLGFGMWAKLHMTGMHVEGKVLVGVKFLPKWPFLGRLRICFAEPPYFQMTVKPIFTHGLDVTELPGIAGWIDKILSMAFEQTLVEPNMLVVDVEKFASPTDESWFSVDEKEPVAYARVEVIEACDMKPSDLNGFADPYLKGQVGAYRFRTKIQRKTLTPKWYEEFKVPISTWELPNVLAIEVRDKDHFVDDILGNCSVNISDLRDGRRHDIWLPLQNIKTGRLHLAITILESNGKFVQEDDRPGDQETLNPEDRRNSFASKTANKSSFSSASSEKSPKASIVADSFEPINIEGQRETGIWVHHPGSEISPTWEPRKGKSRLIDTEIQREPNDRLSSINSVVSGSIDDESSSTDENADGKNRMNRVRRGLRKIGSVFHRSPRTKDNSGSIVEAAQSPRANLRAVNAKEISVDFIMEDTVFKAVSGKVAKEEETTSPGGSGAESPGRGNVKNMAKSILKHAEISARSFKHVLTHKGSKKSLDNSLVATEREISAESDSSDDDSLSSPIVNTIAVVSNPIPRCNANEPISSQENIVQADASEPATEIGVADSAENAEPATEIGVADSAENAEPATEFGVADSAENASFDDKLEKIDIENVSTSKKCGDGLVEGSSIPKLSDESADEVKS